MGMYKQYTLLEEPKDAEYVALLRTLSRFCRYALLVVRPNMPLSVYGRQTLQELEPDIALKDERHEWPGKRLLNGTATIYLIRLTSATLETLCSRANRLYEWEQPLLPEDLCLMRNESEPLLVNTSHERDAYLLLSEYERQELLAALSNLRIREESVY